MTLRIGSLCSGYGGLDMAVQHVLGGELAWVADPYPGAAAILKHHHPDVPNLGDITTTDWDDVSPIDILLGGFPCQDLSYAGRGAGIKEGTRSGLWTTIADAIGALRPRLVVLENVRAIVGRRPGLDVVLADLARLGFDASWTCLRASDVGAPHPRDRWFCIAYPTTPNPECGRWERRPWDLTETRRRDEPAHRGHQTPTAGIELLPTPTVADARGTRNYTAVRRDGAQFNSGKTLTDVAWLLEDNARQWVTTEGIDYGPAIYRWEPIIGRPAPAPTEPGTKDNWRLTPLFVEWMQGLPAGHITEVPGVSRAAQITLGGNGVVPRHAAFAVAGLLAELGRRPAA